MKTKAIEDDKARIRRDAIAIDEAKGHLEIGRKMREDAKVAQRIRQMRAKEQQEEMRWKVDRVSG